MWIEIPFVNNKNIFCDIIHRQQNSPHQIISYFEETIEKLITALKDTNNGNVIVKEHSQIPYILNEHFASVETMLASTIQSTCTITLPKLCYSIQVSNFIFSILIGNARGSKILCTKQQVLWSMIIYHKVI